MPLQHVEAVARNFVCAPVGVPQRLVFSTAIPLEWPRMRGGRRRHRAHVHTCDDGQQRKPVDLVPGGGAHFDQRQLDPLFLCGVGALHGLQHASAARLHGRVASNSCNLDGAAFSDSKGPVEREDGANCRAAEGGATFVLQYFQCLAAVALSLPALPPCLQSLLSHNLVARRELDQATAVLSKKQLPMLLKARKPTRNHLEQALQAWSFVQAPCPHASRTKTTG